ncbi:amidohydrolase [Curvibacter sp. RS43]|uniref:amidohydrolase n=1 Tax=Curvibacter microcysteis TaxID=3026419 RepID=UPI002360B7F5|nr:amidohydrolase [Curvibacter sp. RS43]MDD0812132.1 amidohydrolase [Curvibacter sp. RS43]
MTPFSVGRGRRWARLNAVRCALLGTALGALTSLQAQSLDAASLKTLDQRISAVSPQLVSWRRDIHSHPELSGAEVRTAKLVADHLRRLGLEVQTGVGGHGVVGILRGGRPGKMVALRADMDALPVQELTGLPFASKVKANYLGQEVSVAHACGHDGHTAILMGVAEVLAGMKAELPGSVKFIFQPAEEGVTEAPDAHGHVPSFGAKAMVEQGVLKEVQAIYGLHLTANIPQGLAGYRSGATMASADDITIEVTGRGGHGSAPWLGVDPVVAAGQVVLGLQTVVSRQLNLTQDPVVVTVGAINGGNRGNVIPDKVVMLGSLRAFDEDMRQEAQKRIVATAQQIAASSGAKATVSFGPMIYPVTVNSPALTEASLPALKLAMRGQVVQIPKVSGSEDFSQYQKVVPGFFFFLGGTPVGLKAETAPSNHSPLFDFNEDALPLGVRALSLLALDFLQRS